MEQFLALLAAALALMGSPGPATLSSAGAGAAFGRRALPYVLGISCGTCTVIILVASGLTGLILALPGVAPVVSLLAAAYILYLAWKIATAPPVGELGAEADAPPLLGGYALAIVNPKAYGAMAALFSGFPLIPDDPANDAILKASILITFPFLINISWMLAGAALAKAMRDPGKSRALNITFAVLLILSVMVSVLL